MKARARMLAALSMIAVFGVIGTSASVPVDASPTAMLANWRMNEGVNARQMADASKNKINGTIGRAIVAGTKEGSAKFYRWIYASPTQPPAKPQRLVQVDDDRLNPGTRDFAITVRFRTTRPFGNMIQKGQAGGAGGYFKWQIPNGKLTCLFRGRSPSGEVLSIAVNSGTNLLNDGQWHEVRCERTADRVTMTIDGTITRRGLGPTGNITNTMPLTIGGKLKCDQIKVTCDYFVGDIDYVRIQTG